MNVLGISGSLRQDSHNTKLLRAAARELPPGVTFEILDGLRDVPAYDEDIDRDPKPAAVERLREAIVRRGRAAVRDARVQLVHPRCAEERPRLAVASAGHEPAALHAGRGRRGEHGRVRRGVGPGGAPQGARGDGRPGRRRAMSPSATPTRSSTTTASSSDEEVREQLGAVLGQLDRRGPPPRRGGRLSTVGSGRAALPCQGAGAVEHLGGAEPPAHVGQLGRRPPPGDRVHAVLEHARACRCAGSPARRKSSASSRPSRREPASRAAPRRATSQSAGSSGMASMWP